MAEGVAYAKAPVESKRKAYEHKNPQRGHSRARGAANGSRVSSARGGQ